MKRTLLIMIFMSALALSPGLQSGGGQVSEKSLELFGQGNVVQIGVVVKDIEKASAAYARFLGVAAPKWAWTDAEDKAHTQYKGKPSPARAKLGFIQLKNITLELIEPDGNPSTWREFLDTRGE